MELGTTIVGIVIILLCTAPFIWLNIKRNKKEKELIDELFMFASKSNCTISEHEIWKNSLIGLDATNSKIFFIRTINNIKSYQHIDLKEIQTCELNNISRTVKYKDKDHKVIERIELEFMSVNQSDPKVYLEIYNADLDGLSLSGQLQIAEKWIIIFRSRIKDLKKVIV